MNRDERALLELFRKLDAAERKTLVDFAEFLASRSGAQRKCEPDEPVLIERPENETVVMAIKRLTRSYPMLDRRKLIADTSRLIAEHALEGRAAREVIDELEVVFAKHYKATRSTE